MAPVAGEGGMSWPSVGVCVSGTMTAAMARAAGAWMTDAVRMWPSASGMTPPSTAA